MNAEEGGLLAPLVLSWNLRNTLERPSSLFPGRFSFESIAQGVYPIDAWRTFPLEVPSSGTKTEIRGRVCHAFGVDMPAAEWSRLRIVSLPVYQNGDGLDLDGLRTVVRRWPGTAMEDIPCIALAMKMRGSYCEDREAQVVAVLLVWGDSACRVVTLDWSEGPLEDCVTPEWRIHASPLLDLRHARAELQGMTAPVHWDQPRFSIFPLPTCLGARLAGAPVETSYRLWRREWQYDTHEGLRKDLDSLLTDIQMLFTVERGE